MTYHPDSFKQGTPASYYCSECKYRHNKGSIRYHDHWMWRTDTPEVLKGRKHLQQGVYLIDILLIATMVAIVVSVGSMWKKKFEVPEAQQEAVGEPAITANYTPNGMYVWHDDQREVTCYIYVGSGISCVADTKKMLWLAQNPKGVPPQ